MNASSPGPIDLLILAAYPPELAGLRALLGERLEGHVSGTSVVCKAVGVGLPNASSGTTARLLQRRPRAVVLVGTCGYYPAAPIPIGVSIVARRVHLLSPIEAERRGAMPDPMSRALDCNAPLARGLGFGQEPLAAIANTLVVTTDDALAAQLGASSGCAVENLEAFGVGNACALQDVPFACVLGVSNRVGSTGRDEWRAHHKAAGQAACDVVGRWIAAGALGLTHA